MLTFLPILILLHTLLIFSTASMVAFAKYRYKVQTSAISEHPVYDKANKVHLNLIENTVLFLPLIFISIFLASNLGGVLFLYGIWLLGRLIFIAGYNYDRLFVKYAGNILSIGVFIGLWGWMAVEVILSSLRI